MVCWAPSSAWFTPSISSARRARRRGYQDVTGGIAEALVATGRASSSLSSRCSSLNHFNKRIRLALHQMDLLKVMVLNRLYGGGSCTRRLRAGRACGERPPR